MTNTVHDITACALPGAPLKKNRPFFEGRRISFKILLIGREIFALVNAVKNFFSLIL